MGERTTIEWTDATWNPVVGCSRVSAGCENCYAERMAGRFSRPGLPFHGLVRQTKHGHRWTGKVRTSERHLYDPLDWRKPRRIFVCSMSDLFHEAVRDDKINDIFAVMAVARWHRFMVLTKRPKRMHEWFYRMEPIAVWRSAARLNPVSSQAISVCWPLRHVLLGVSVENQTTAEDRIPLLLATPALSRFVSAEPLLGPLRLDRWLGLGVGGGPGLDWVIVGGESGPGARPMDLAWVRDIRDQCARASVPFFFKQAIVNGQKVSTPELDGCRHTESPAK